MSPGSHDPDREQRIAMPVREQLPALGPSPRIEASMRAVISRHGLKQVGGRVGRQPLLGQLAAIADFREIAVDEARRESVAEIALTVEKPSQISRRRWVAANRMAFAATSGW